MRTLIVFWLGAGCGHSQTHFVPFTLTEVSQRFDTTGKVVSESRFLFARDRNGSIVSVDLDPSAGRTRQIVDVTNRRMVVIDPNSKSATESSYQISGVAASDACEARFRSFEGATISVNRSAGKVSDVPVELVTVTLPRAMVLEILMAPSLGCHMLESVAFRNGRVASRRFCENLRVGDADAALFEVPTNYRVSKLPDRGW